MAILSQADHEHFIEHGYVVLRGVVPTATIRAAIEALEAGSDGSGADASAVADCTTDTMLDGIAELFGAPNYTLARRRGGSDMPRPHQPDGAWREPVAHVDDSYPTIMPNGWAVGSFVFLTRVQQRGGAFVVFPGSYRRYREQLAESCHSIKGAAALVEISGESLQFLAEPGDVLLFHHLTGHTGSDNLTDPVTRHALLSRWHPEQTRIVPGAKDFDAMSTIEKANSARYLAHHYGHQMHLAPGPDPGSHVLSEGFCPNESLQTSAILHFGGQLHLLATTATDPRILRHWTSASGLDWVEQDAVDTYATRITSIQLHQYDLPAILAVTVSEGRATLSGSTDFKKWQSLAVVADCVTLTPWFVYAQYPSKVAGGRALYEVRATEPHRLRCHWGDAWSEADAWDTDAVALHGPADRKLEDVTIAAHVADSSCTFVVDVTDEETQTSAPWYVQPADVAVAAEALRPLPFDTASPPSRLRIVNRARNYWLVTYLRAVSGQQRLFWGFVDWDAAEPTLTEIKTQQALFEARQIVGFI